MSNLFSLEAEQSVIGSLLVRPDLIDVISSNLVPANFYYPEHVEIFRTILNLQKKNTQVDVISVADALVEITFSTGEREYPLAYLTDLVRNTPSVVNAKTYADIVKDYSVCRDIVKISYEAKDIAESKIDMQDKISKVNSLVALLDSETNDNEVIHISDILPKHVEEIQRRFDLGGEIDGLSTGHIDLDNSLLGLKPSELYVIAARPAMGKTVLGVNIATHNAIHAKKKVLVISLEMSDIQLSDRIIASVGSIPLKEMKTGQVACNYSSQLTSAVNLIKDSGLYLSEHTNLNINQLRSMARRHKLKHGLDLLVIDYLQLMSGTGGENRTGEISEITRGLKNLARELDIPVVALSQLNRTLEQRQNKRPINSDLRESGSIEQDADVIMFIYRDEVYSGENSKYKGVAELIIGKYRNGELGTIYTAFNGAMCRFDPLAKGWRPEEDQPPPTPSNVRGFTDRYRTKEARA